jgi:hypothetical protein
MAVIVRAQPNPDGAAQLPLSGGQANGVAMKRWSELTEVMSRDVGYHRRSDLTQKKEISMLDVGASVPDFKLKSHEGEEVSLGQYAGKWVVLHTFPFAFTGG